MKIIIPPDSTLAAILTVCKKKHRLTLLLSVGLLLSGCLAQPIIPSEADMQKVGSLLIIPVEAPPLEIISDPIEERMPAYRHFNNMSLFFPSVPDITYRNKEGVVMIGRVAADEDVQEIHRDGSLTGSLVSLGAADNGWLPTLAFSQRVAAAGLVQSQMNAVLSDHYYRLPINNNGKNIRLQTWRKAIANWYGKNLADVDYQRLMTTPVDAIAEIGIGSLRVFDNQCSMQVFIKLIKPDTGQVIARAQDQGVVPDCQAQGLVNGNSKPFKHAIINAGTGFLLGTFREIGLLRKNG